MASDKKMFSRRHILSLAGGTLGLIATGSVFRTATSATKPSAPSNPRGVNERFDAAQHTSEATTDATVQEVAQSGRQNASSEALKVLGAVKIGTQLGLWRVAEIHDIHFGAVPVVLESEAGGRYQVDVLRRDGQFGAIRGVADTRRLSLFLANQGSGSTSSNEHHGLGLMTLAAAIRQSEPLSLPSNMLTFAGREARHPRASYTVLA